MTSKPTFPAPIEIRNSQSWHEFARSIIAEPQIAIDLEANSLYAYREQICLIQVSTPYQDFIIDPLVGLDLNPLGKIVENPDCEKIFHAAEYDLILMKRQFGWRLVNLFDTMWAARILGYTRYGLASLLQKFYGITLSKKYQKTNWCRRPLTDGQKQYAQRDTHYLLQLRNDLARELNDRGRMEEALEIFREQTDVQLPANSFDPDDFWKINGVASLSKRSRAIARALYIFRDQQANKQDRPPFKVFQDRTLLEIAEKKPRTLDAFESIHGMTDTQIRRYGRSLLQVVDKASGDPIPRRPRNNYQRPPEEVYNRYEQLRSWRKERALKRGVESDVIIGRSAMWAIARANPRSISELSAEGVLGPWRTQAYGEEIVNVIAEISPGE